MRTTGLKWGLVIFMLVAGLLAGCTPLNPDMSYQGQLTDSSGNPVANGNYQITFRLYEDEGDTVAQAIWSETQTVQVADGLFNATIGAVNPIEPGLFAQELWLGVEVAGDGEMTPRQKLSGAPYAMSLVPGAGMQGVVNIDAEYPGMFNINNRGSGLGLGVNFWGKGGVAIDGAFDPTGDITVGDTGLIIDHVQHGGVITSTEGIGLHIITTGATPPDDKGIRVDSDSDGIVAVTDGDNVGDYGVYGQGNVGPGIFGKSNGAYAGVFDGDIDVNGCTGCALRYTARNASDQTLELGDLVTAAGVDASLPGRSLPVIRVAPATTGQAVLGVVVGRVEISTGTAEDGSQTPLTFYDSVGGPAAPGDYLVFVVQGPAQVRLDPAADIQAGNLLYFGASGLTTMASGAAIGMVLEAINPTGLVWVMVGFH